MMRSGRSISQFYKGSIISALALILQVVPSYAEDVVPPETDAARTLETILKQAGEKGLLQVGDADTPKVHDANSPAVIYQNLIDVELNCALADVYDFSGYVSVTSFDEAFKLKSSTTNYNALIDVMPLAKTYLALGLGAEVVSLTRQFDEPKAYLLASVARVIEGVSTDMDHRYIEKHASCNELADFWSQVSTAVQADMEPSEYGVSLSVDQLQLLEDLPDHLERTVTTRLGIHAAEQGSKKLAEQLLAKIEPRSKASKLPEVKSDAHLYYYALVRRMKGDPTSQQILSHLGQYDGLYRTKALHQLVQQNTQHGTELYENFSQDLLAVKQQYNGQTQGREATVEIIRQQVNNDKFIMSVELAKSEFSEDDPERLSAVILIGDKIHDRLGGDSDEARLFALNGYMYDVEFFVPYPKIDELIVAAYQAAMGLNLPELAEPILGETANDPSDKAYASARLAFKKAEYHEVLSIAKAGTSDDRIEELVLQSAIALGDKQSSANYIKPDADGRKASELKATLAWRNAEWGHAKKALEGAAGEGGVDGLETKIAVADYVSGTGAPEDIAIPTTAGELDVFNKQISGDIAIVKAYLSDG